MRSVAWSMVCACTVVSMAAATPTRSWAAGQADSGTRSLIEAGHWKQARAMLEPRVRANPSDAEAAALLSQVRSADGDLDARWRSPKRR